MRRNGSLVYGSMGTASVSGAVDSGLIPSRVNPIGIHSFPA